MGESREAKESLGGKGKGDGEAGGKGCFGKGYWGGYQGTCFQCGQVGRKAAECGVHAVEEASSGAEGGAAATQELPMGGVWTVAAVEAVEAERSGGGWRAVRANRTGRRVGAGSMGRKSVGPVNELGEKPRG